MKTIVIRPPAGIGRDRTATVAARPLTGALAELVVAGLAAGGIHVAAHLGRVVHVEALIPLTAVQEVRAIAAFRAVTDSRLTWKPEVNS